MTLEDGSHEKHNALGKPASTERAIDSPAPASSNTSIATTSVLTEDDPQHPYRWSRSKKWTHVVLLSVIEFVTPLASMMFAPVVPQVAADIANNNITRTTLAVSIYVLGFIIGPLILGPLSELYGRMVIYRTTVTVYAVLSACCAVSTTIDMLTVFRFFAGCFGAAPIVVGAAAVADMFPPVSRGRPVAVYSVGPLLGMTSGPIFGGLINHSAGWRWIFGALSILAGVLAICTFVILRETHLPTITKNSKRSSRTLRCQSLRNGHRLESRPGLRLRLRTVLLPASLLPIQIIFGNLQMFLLFLSNAVFTGIMNILFTTLGATYQSRYGFTTQLAGLAYIGIGIGGVIASIVLAKTSDKMVHFLSRRLTNDGDEHLERYRLPPLIAGAVLVSLGLIWYGWAVQLRDTWVVPLLGTFIFGLGMLLTQATVPTFLVHAFPDHAGSVMSASVVTRSVGGSVLTLAGPSMNKTLGHGWASTLLAFVNLMFLLPAIMLFRNPTTKIYGWDHNEELKAGNGLEKAAATVEDSGSLEKTRPLSDHTGGEDLDTIDPAV